MEKSLSRRDFLKMAGVAGAAVGVGGGLAGAIAGCGGGDRQRLPPGRPATTAPTTAATTATTEGSTTTVSAAAEDGRAIKLGCVSPLTGPASAFGIPDKWIKDEWLKAAGDGLVFGDGKKHPITIEMRDSQSDTNRAAQVAGDLIQNDKIDMMMVSSSPDTVNPVADQCEAMAMPCLSSDCPMEPYYFGRGATPDKPFKWTYLVFWGNYEIMQLTPQAYDQVPNNKVVGGVWSNEVDGEARRASLTPFFKDAGYTLIDGGPYQVGTEDYTSMISLFKKNAVEVVNFLGIPPDLVKLLDAVPPAGVPSEDRGHGQSHVVPFGDGSAWGERLQHDRSVVVASDHALEVHPHRRGLSHDRAPVREGHRQPVDATADALRHLRVGRGRVQAGHEHRRQRRDHEGRRGDKDGGLDGGTDRLHRSGRAQQSAYRS